MWYDIRNSRTLQTAVALCLIAATLCGATTIMKTRKAVLAGSWFPAEPQAVFTAVKQYIDAAPPFSAPGKMVACIVPHSQLSVAGPISAPIFKQAVRGAYDNVIVLTGFHYGKFGGASIPAVQLYESPLGAVPVDATAMRELTWNPLIVRKSVSYNERLFQSGQRMAVHEREHGIEAVLPYLQAQLGTFLLVPIVVGDLADYRGKPDKESIESIARTIAPLITDRTLVVCATHFTQYGAQYKYEPFRENIQRNIQMLDLDAMQFISRRDLDGFLAYLEETKNPIDGAMALAVFIRLLPKGVKAELMQRTTTARITGNDGDSVSMASIAFFHPSLPVPVPTEIRPDLIRQASEAAEDDESELPAEAEAEPAGE